MKEVEGRLQKPLSHCHFIKKKKKHVGTVTRNFALNSSYSFGMHPASVKFIYPYTNFILLLHLIKIQYS